MGQKMICEPPGREPLPKNRIEPPTDWPETIEKPTLKGPELDPRGGRGEYAGVNLRAPLDAT